MKGSKEMRNIAKIVLIVFVLILEVGYADDCRKKLYEKYKAHSAEFIKLKNKCKPLLENVVRLVDEYRNTIAYKEYEAVKLQYDVKKDEWFDSAEYRGLQAKHNQCYYSIMNKRMKELEDIAKKNSSIQSIQASRRGNDLRSKCYL